MRAIDIISIIIILSLSICSWGGNAQPAPQYSGFRLSLQWPAAFCQLNPTTCKKDALLNTFTIHGLWPYNNKGNPLPNCKTGNAFSRNSVKNILADLNALWPTISSEFKSNQDFWKYEWDKHGKCSETTDFTQTDYFKNAIALRKKADILVLLEKEGITPDHTNPRSGTDIKAAIETQLKDNPRIELVCPGNVFLGVNLCVNKLATKFVNCPATVPPAPNCDTDLKFIPLANHAPPLVTLDTPLVNYLL